MRGYILFVGMPTLLRRREASSPSSFDAAVCLASTAGAAACCRLGVRALDVVRCVMIAHMACISHLHPGLTGRCDGCHCPCCWPLPLCSLCRPHAHSARQYHLHAGSKITLARCQPVRQALSARAPTYCCVFGPVTNPTQKATMQVQSTPSWTQHRFVLIDLALSNNVFNQQSLPVTQRSTMPWGLAHPCCFFCKGRASPANAHLARQVLVSSLC